MNFSEILREKKQISDNIKNLYCLPKKHKALWLIKIEDISILEKLQEWLKFLPANFIIESNEKSLVEYDNIQISNNTDKLRIGFDFIVCDENIEDLNDYISKWVVPIIINTSHLSAILAEFNPLKNEWNSYLFKEENEYDIYYAIIRYLENFKFPFDNKNLVKNICDM